MHRSSFDLDLVDFISCLHCLQAKTVLNKYVGGESIMDSYFDHK